MDTQKPIDETLEEIFQRSQEKDYKRRIMDMKIDAEHLESGGMRVKGTLNLKVSETPDNDKSWKEKEFSVMIMEDDAEVATGLVLAHLNSIPYEWGDMIFEEDFEDAMKLLEGSKRGKTKVQAEEAPLH